jgi:polysaccharide chain length determinant protein (PEP-CTERM system associated)
MDTTPDTLMPSVSYAVDAGQGSVRRSLTMIYRRRWWVVVPAAVVTLAFAAAAWWMPPRYRSEVLLSSGAVVSRDLENQAPMIDVQKQLVGINEVVKRRSLLEQVIREHELYPLADGEVRENDLQDMMSRVTVRVQGNKTFSLGFEDSDRRRAAAVASELASMVIDEGSTERFERAEATSSFVTNQVEALRTKLTEQERQIEQYKARYFAELPQYQGANQAVIDSAREQLGNDEETIAENEARRAAITREMRELEQQGVNAKPVDSRLRSLEVQLAQLEKRYTDEHPEVGRVRDEIAALEAAGDTGLGAGGGAPLQIRYLQLAAEADAVDQRLRSARSARDHTLGMMSRARRQSEAGPRHEMTLSVMQREYDSNREQYDALVKRQQDSDMALRLETADNGAQLRVVEPARVPIQPFSPHRSRILLMGLVAGLALGIAAAFVVEQADTTFREIDEVQRFTGLPVLTAIPAIPPRRRPRGEGGPQPNAVMATDPFGHVAEQYRILATKLRARTAGRRPVVILVTSPMGGEGKTTTATNLALALSERADEAVALVDADLRKAGVHRFLGRPHGKGLKELLADPDADVAPYLRRFDHLHLIQAGGSMTAEVSAAGDLSSEHAQRVFRRLRERFAFIVVDAPPLLAMAESHILQHMADLVLLVVRAGLTPKELVLRALESLDEAPNLNIVLNDADTATTAYGYVYKYYESHYNPSVASGRAE